MLRWSLSFAEVSLTKLLAAVSALHTTLAQHSKASCRARECASTLLGDMTTEAQVEKWCKEIMKSGIWMCDEAGAETKIEGGLGKYTIPKPIAEVTKADVEAVLSTENVAKAHGHGHIDDGHGGHTHENGEPCTGHEDGHDHHGHDGHDHHGHDGHKHDHDHDHDHDHKEHGKEGHSHDHDGHSHKEGHDHKKDHDGDCCMGHDGDSHKAHGHDDHGHKDHGGHGGHDH
jgi:hypothetical protein